jgi:hypothetical protein
VPSHICMISHPFKIYAMQDSYLEVHNTMVKNNIPIAKNGILSQCLSGLTSPHVPGSAPCPPSSSAGVQENQ